MKGYADMSKHDNGMSDKRNTITKKINPVWVLVFIIAAQLLYTIFVFCFEKDNFHCDEVWSYGLANSYYQPFIYANDGIYIDDITEDDYINLNAWLPGSVMNDYLTVQKGEAFSYDAVYHNQTLDHHPPLFYMLLHTVSSFFPDTFSPLFGLFLNCIFLIGTQMLLYKLSKLIFRSKFYALLVCGFYALGVGSLSTFLYIRQYGLLTMLTAAYLYCNARLFYDKKDNLKKHLLPIVIVSFAAFMTHYYAIVFIGVFTALFGVLYLCRRKLRQMFVYGGSVLLTLLLYFAVYPAALMQLTTNSFDGQPNMTYMDQLLLYIMHIVRNNIGFRVSFIKGSAQYTVLAILFSLVVLSIPLCFLFRNETWFKKFAKKTLCAGSYTLRQLKAMLLHGDRFPFMILLAATVEVLVVNKIVSATKMGVFAQRYIFNIFPYASMLTVYTIRRVLFLLPKMKKYAKPVVAVVLALLAVNIHRIESTKFTMDTSPRFQQICEDLEGKNCLFVLDSHTNIALLTNIAAFSRLTDHVLCTYFEDVDIYKDEIFDSGIDIDYVILSSTGYLLNETQKAYYENEHGAAIDADADGLTELVKGLTIDHEEVQRDTDAFNAYFGEKALVPHYILTANGLDCYVMTIQ